MTNTEVETIAIELVSRGDEYASTSHDLACFRRDWPEEAARFPPCSEKIEFFEARKAFIERVPLLCHRLREILDPPPIKVIGKLMAIVSRTEQSGICNPYVPGGLWSAIRARLRGLSLTAPGAVISEREPSAQSVPGPGTMPARRGRPPTKPERVARLVQLYKSYKKSGLTKPDYAKLRQVTVEEIEAGRKHAGRIDARVAGKNGNPEEHKQIA
jgi:hypothetical protein